VNSVLAQTFTDWEAIIVDDGSTDNTREVAAQFTDPRIRYIYQDNRGLSAARNTGLQNARSEFIALLDADDTWKPRFLERMMATLRENPTATAAYCGFQWIDAEGLPLRQSVMRVVAPERFYEELLYHGNWISACSVVVRLTAYRAAGPFDESLRACEDTDMWLRMAQNSAQFIGVPEVLVFYRRTSTNMSDDVDRMRKALATVLEKHVGPLDTPVETWNEAKRVAVRQLYSLQTQGYLAQGRITESAESLVWLLRYHPGFALSLDLWYSLACVHQLVGQRGDFDTWDPERGKADVFAILEQLVTYGTPQTQLRTMYAQANFALALLNYGKRRSSVARRYLFSSVRFDHLLLVNRRWLQLAVRLAPGMLFLKLFSEKMQSVYLRKTELAKL
jgi:glycosyltransferase involved in cell wall biosynthesis